MIFQRQVLVIQKPLFVLQIGQGLGQLVLLLQKRRLLLGQGLGLLIQLGLLVAQGLPLGLQCGFLILQSGLLGLQRGFLRSQQRTLFIQCSRFGVQHGKVLVHAVAENQHEYQDQGRHHVRIADP